MSPRKKFVTDGVRLIEELTRDQGWNCSEINRNRISIDERRWNCKSNFSMDQVRKRRQTQKYIAGARERSLPSPCWIGWATVMRKESNSGLTNA